MELLQHERPISVDMKEGLYPLAKVKKKRQRQICSVRLHLQMYMLAEFQRYSIKRSQPQRVYTI